MKPRSKTRQIRSFERRPPRAQRLSEDQQRQFKSRSNAGDDVSPSGDRRQNIQRTSDKEKVDNVHLSLSPRLLELAEELAAETKMATKTYLTELLKYALLAHGGRLGKRDKYVTEFKSQNRLKVSTWNNQPKEKTSAGSFTSNRRDDRRFGTQSQGSYRGGAKGKPKFRSESLGESGSEGSFTSSRRDDRRFGTQSQGSYRGGAKGKPKFRSESSGEGGFDRPARGSFKSNRPSGSRQGSFKFKQRSK